MKVIVGGETSGRVRDAFRRLGHDAISCDFLPSDAPGPHYQGDYWDLARSRKWDLGIFHPTCTYMCNSGVRHLYTEAGRFDKMRASAKEFKMLLELDYPIVVENPIMHRYALEIVGRRHDQIVQPWMYGHKETKATCFWLNDVEPLLPTFDLGPPRPEERKEWAVCHRARPSADRWKVRSETKQGIADAMAWQWGRGFAPGVAGALVRLDYQATQLLQVLRDGS